MDQKQEPSSVRRGFTERGESARQDQHLRGSSRHGGQAEPMYRGEMGRDESCSDTGVVGAI